MKAQFWQGKARFGMMMGLVLIVAGVLAGCGTTEQPTPTVDTSSPTPTETPIQVVQADTATPTLTATATVTLQPTATLTPVLLPTDDDLGIIAAGNNSGQSGSGGSVYVPLPCTPRADWPLYTIVRGDTLSNIARRVNSSAATLATANCLTDPNTITVGMPLRVPVVPPTTVEQFTVSPYVASPGQQVTFAWQTTGDVASVTLWRLDQQGRLAENIAQHLAADGVQTVTVPEYPLGDVRYYLGALDAAGSVLAAETVTLRVSPDIAYSGRVAASSGAWGEGDTWVLPYEGQTTLTWLDAPTDVVEILFFYQHFRQDGALDAPIWIGTDDNPADGARINWDYHGEFHGALTAHASLGGDIPAAVTANPLYVLSQPEAPQQVGQLVSSSGAWGEDDTWVLPYEGQTTLTWPEAPTDVVEILFFYQHFRQDGVLDAPIWIGTDDNPADGARINWDYHGQFHGALTAHASMGGDIPAAVTADALLVRSQAGDLPQVGRVVADTGEWRDGGSWVLPYDGQTTLTWPEAPTNADAVTFYYEEVAQDGSRSAPAIIGTDSNPADGASIGWDYSGSFLRLVTAQAMQDDVPVVETATMLAVRSEPAQNPERIGRVLAGSGAWGDDGNWVLLYEGQTTLTWSEAPTDVAEVVFYYQDVAQDGSRSAPVSIGTDFTPADGAAVVWDYSGSFQRVLWAHATMGGDIPVVVTAEDLPVFSQQDTQDWGTISVEPPGEIEREWMRLIIATNVTLRWDAAPRDATYVEFYLTGVSGTTSSLLGTDQNPADGASIPFTVPELDHLAALTATAFMADGRQINPSQLLTISTEQGPLSGQGMLLTDPAGRDEGGWTVLPVGQTVDIIWQDAPAAFQRVEFALSPTGTGMTPEVFGTDADASDGASIPWTVLGGSGHVTATAYLADGRTVIPLHVLQFVGE